MAGDGNLHWRAEDHVFPESIDHGAVGVGVGAYPLPSRLVVRRLVVERYVGACATVHEVHVHERLAPEHKSSGRMALRAALYVGGGIGVKHIVPVERLVAVQPHSERAVVDERMGDKPCELGPPRPLPVSELLPGGGGLAAARPFERSVVAVRVLLVPVRGHERLHHEGRAGGHGILKTRTVRGKRGPLWIFRSRRIGLKRGACLASAS